MFVSDKFSGFFRPRFHLPLPSQSIFWLHIEPVINGFSFSMWKALGHFFLAPVLQTKRLLLLGLPIFGLQMFNGRIGYFSVVVIKHHDQKKCMKNESVFCFNSTGTILVGGMAASRRRGAQQEAESSQLQP